MSDVRCELCDVRWVMWDEWCELCDVRWVVWYVWCEMRGCVDCINGCCCCCCCYYGLLCVISWYPSSGEKNNLLKFAKNYLEHCYCNPGDPLEHMTMTMTMVYTSIGRWQRIYKYRSMQCRLDNPLLWALFVSKSVHNCQNLLCCDEEFPIRDG